MARPRSTVRDDLLASIVDHVVEHGIGELSLRPLADAIGTSHRMLLFHFGSKEALMADVVRTVEARQRDALSALTNRAELSNAERMQLHWRGLLDPQLRNSIRLFYEVYADALRGRPYTKDFLDEVMSAWMGPITEALVAGAAGEAGAAGAADHARVDARLLLAVTRGLLLDLVTTGDVDGVDAAMRRFGSLFGSRAI
jgi:AcrR family transcriptional regulator